MKRTKEKLEAARKKKAMKFAGKEFYLSDHALWRYAEDRWKFPSLEAVRKQVQAHLDKLGSMEKVYAAGFRIQGKTICTFLRAKDAAKSPSAPDEGCGTD